MRNKINFQFYNSVSPRYIHSLLIPLEYGVWYSTVDLIDALRRDFNIDGRDVVINTIGVWRLIEFIEVKPDNDQDNRIFFRLTGLGNQLKETYSTNRDLFFDLMYYLFYAPWKASHSPTMGKFWVYSRACDILWDSSPNPINRNDLAGILQDEAQDVFPGYDPKFSERSVGSIYPWLLTLTPPFLIKTSQQSFSSNRRKYCSPQLFHLALDLVYNNKQLKYGTSMAIGEDEICSICRVCLLDKNEFWEMADRTRMVVKGVEIRKGQFSTSIALNIEPSWIELPSYRNLDEGYDLLGGKE